MIAGQKYYRQKYKKNTLPRDILGLATAGHFLTRNISGTKEQNVSIST